MDKMNDAFTRFAGEGGDNALIDEAQNVDRKLGKFDGYFAIFCGIFDGDFGQGEFCEMVETELKLENR